MAKAVAGQAADVEFAVTDTSLDVDVYGDVAVVASFGEATLRSPRGDRTGPYRLSGTLLRDGNAWKWRVYHGSEPMPW